MEIIIPHLEIVTTVGDGQCGFSVSVFVQISADFWNRNKEQDAPNYECDAECLVHWVCLRTTSANLSYRPEILMSASAPMPCFSFVICR